MRLRVHRIPFSTNVERVALAAAHKGVDVDWVDHDPADRSSIVALSGQAFVPILELDGRDFLLGDTLGIADVIAFPFLKYAASIEAGDPDQFHHVLAEHLALGDDYERLRGWITRCDALPRA